jgi:16S rRNA (uracil1498-N3)-methyltransferase
MRRFFIDRKEIVDGEVVIAGDLFRHLARVLRMKPGARVSLADGEGGEYMAVITAITEERLHARIEILQATIADSADPAITLLQGIPKGERMELILQKGTELGAAGFIPFLSSRTIPRLTGEKATERRRRWERIVMEAARQSRRPEIPVVAEISPFSGTVRSVHQEVRLLLWEGEQQRGLRELLEETPRPSSVALLVGPEGGLSPEEATEAVAAGFIPVTLGPRILRTETAGLAVLAILQYVWGDVG